MADRDASLSRRDVLAAGSASVGAVLAGCMGGSAPGDGGSGEEFVYLTTQQPSSIDPARSLDELEAIYNSNVYEPLVRYNTEFPPSVTAGVAADWEVADDDVTYTFDLHEDLTFHNGDSLTAEDVVYTVERLLSINAGPTWMWSGVLTEGSATAVDETTVEIQLEQPYAPFLKTLPWLCVVNKQQVESNGDGEYGGDYLENNEAGSGPWMLEEYARGEEIRLSRNDDWWGEFADNVADTVVINTGMEVSTIVGSLTNGDGHITDRWLSTANYEQFESNDNTKLSSTQTYNTYYVYMNMLKPPLDDIHVRRAISYAFDYGTAMDILGTDDELHGPMPSSMQYSTTDGVTQYTQDLDAAREELEQSEYSSDELEVTYVSQPAISANQDIGLMMEDQFSDVGITVNLEDAPWTRIVEMASDPETSPQMFPLWGLVSYDDPNAYLWSMWHSSSVNNYLNGSNYQKDEMDALLEEGRRTLDEDARAEIYKQVQQMIMDDAPALMVANDTTEFGLHQDTTGFSDNGIMGYTHQFQNLGVE
ncbi:ABC transporter substrate-binding protein [Halostella litorea]|uniref:ABC transporter substrate-binding protein n=1 Tax=Halostella litorea TaxID=2528831 RepID=UPI001386C648|nr:ABC transporter substrate-binding protein [Halostella litorea]